jgi:xylan 1,4-beta-xylosidase
MIKNPILSGFNPDPSICRVGKDYYLATSTFEWFPGIMIYHSVDLINWELIARPLNRLSQLDMKGVPDSCGVWAPCLSYSDGLFYLVFTNVKSFDGVWKDTPNYVVITQDIRSDWSEPIYLKSSGFDGSFFHDEGKTWFVSMLVDHRDAKFFGGIELQEFSRAEKRLIGPVHYISEGSVLGKSEGPHIYKRNGYYYLMLAEGGTEYGHAETMFRSRSITGPYESNPNNPFLSSRNSPEYGIQKTGHASIVENEDGSWHIVFLMGRPLDSLGRCTLGRETGIEELIWKNDWPQLGSGSSLPRLEIPELFPLNTNSLASKENRIQFFDSQELPLEFQSLRIPMDESWIDLNDRPECLRLFGKESLSSTHEQTLIGRRIQDFKVEISTCLEFEPDTFQQMAGLCLYYNTGHYHYLHITRDGSKKIVQVISSDNFNYSQQEYCVIDSDKKVVLKARIDRDKLRFEFAFEGEAFQRIGNTLDMSILSDDYVREGSSRYRPAFTGSFACLCVQDLFSGIKEADFHWFHYSPID